MHAINDPFVTGLSARPLPDALHDEDGPWERVMAHLRTWLPASQLLDTLCAAVAAELSLSTVALFRREADGGLSRIAGADDVQLSGKVRDRRAVNGTFEVHPCCEPATPDVECWTFPDHGHSDVLVFAGPRGTDRAAEWGHWARRLAVMIVQAPSATAASPFLPTAAVGAASSFEHSAILLPIGHEPGARFAAFERDVVDFEEQERGEPRVRVTLEGLDALEPLGEGGWQRLLGFSAARLVAIAGADRVTELADGEFRVCLPRDATEAVQVLDALRRALLSPVPGIGAVPALQVHFGPD